MLTSAQVRPTGHTQVKTTGGRRSYYAFWHDANGKHGKRLGSAHVKDSGRRTPRGAVVWRAADGPKPSPEHLVPKEAQALLEDILAAAPRVSSKAVESAHHTLRDAAEGNIAERKREKGLKRGTIIGYEDVYERLYRDFGEDRELEEVNDRELLRDYFASFKAQTAIGRKRARELRDAGVAVEEVTVVRWTVQPPECAPVDVATRKEAEEVARGIGGKWSQMARGSYRVTPPNARRPHRVRRSEAERRREQGWIVRQRETRRWVVLAEPVAQTVNRYRDLLSAALDYAVQQGWIEENAIKGQPRRGRKAERQRILRRDDFYDKAEIAALLAHAPGDLEEAVWLCGFDGGMRLPGEALGLRWGAVDFEAEVVRVYDNFVENQLDTTKTEATVAVPMTPRWRAALWKLKQRGYRTADDDFVHTRDVRGRPASAASLRRAFRTARVAAGLKAIPMYNARHSFGTALARSGRFDVRTIQALMRHDRISTTEQYMAYAPRPDLQAQLTRALIGGETSDSSLPVLEMPTRGGVDVQVLLARLDEELPAKWLHEVRRVCEELAEAGRVVIGAGRGPSARLACS
ncbi:MAG TPA: tyrosine-type recombinase/integrase [Conexibacter sp.]|nr:tyrosine-type recombinase/integrase [Conexibacter sp.]